MVNPRPKERTPGLAVQHQRHGNGVVTVAIVPTEDRKYLRIGFAVCTPDDQFVKRYGTDKAEGRALSKDALFVNNDKSKKEVFDDISYTVEDVIKEKGYGNRWLIGHIRQHFAEAFPTHTEEESSA